MKLPAAAQRVGQLVNARLQTLLDEEHERWSAVDHDLAAPFDALRSYVLPGGKRLRPAFCYWAFVGAGGAREDPAVVDAGAALEMLHTAALVHDDVIDGSARRHGSDSVHVRFAREHRRGRWAGDPQRFGEGTAIIVGDLALVYSSRLMAGAPAAAMSVFEEMRLEVNVGQYLDVLGAAVGVDAAGAVSRAARICRYKTAKYTVERPLHIGAALAAPARAEELTEALSRFGLPLGEAFQLKDDLLGVFGDPSVTGKPVGDDLREGKPTLLASLAAEAAGPEFAAEIGRAGLSESEVHGLQKLIAESGAKTRVESEVSRLVGEAEMARGRLPLTGEAIDALGELAAFVAGRDR
jgi:geranylgeranyl diphosphate synthase type I